MDDKVLLGHLEELAQALGIPVRYEPMEGETPFPRGGLCRIRGDHVIIVNVNARAGERIRTLARALSRFDLSDRYLKPAVRDFLEKFPDEPD